MEYWERNRAVFRVVELTTVEGRSPIPGPAGPGPQRGDGDPGPGHRHQRRGRRVPGRVGSDGRGGDAHRHAGPGGRSPLRVRVLGYPHRLTGRQPGPAPPLVGHRPGRARRGQGRGRRRPAPGGATVPARARGAAWAGGAQAGGSGRQDRAKAGTDRRRRRSRAGPPGHEAPRAAETTAPATTLSRPAPVGAAQRRATGLTGEPRALVKGRGVASSRKS